MTRSSSCMFDASTSGQTSIANPGVDARADDDTAGALRGRGRCAWRALGRRSSGYDSSSLDDTTDQPRASSVSIDSTTSAR
jgi:hypothetical protein